jgi:transposase
MPRQEQLIGRHERDRLIAAMHRKGYSHEKIAHRLGMSRRGVGQALERLAGTGRYNSPPEAGDWSPPRPSDDDGW